MNSLTYALITGLFLFFQSCYEKEKECSGICTEEYRTIIVEIKNSESQPVVLDSFKIVDLRSGRDLTIHQDDNTYTQEDGLYPIFSDRYGQDYKQQQTDIKLTGYKEGEEVLSEVYKVGADCCHVYYISGDLELVL